MKRYVFASALCLIVLSACSTKDERAGITWNNIEKSLQAQISMAGPGDTISLDSGYFWFTRTLHIDGKENLHFRGQGMDKTVLSFRGQEEGAEGIKIAHGSNITVSGMTVEDAKGDNIKITETDGITFSEVKVWWTGGAKSSNGAYGLYPVLCRNVLIEDCVAARASDAGIYVGQSEYVIIRRNDVWENVAGIESENSSYVDIYENETINNTGGILVFDLPGLTRYGYHTRVFNNRVASNNHKNFAPKGNIVGMVPPGTGIMVLASRDLEIFNNQIHHNRTAAVAIISYELVNELGAAEEPSSDEDLSLALHNQNYQLDTLYNPFPENIFLHSNSMKNKHWFPTMKSDFGKLLLFKFPFRTPHILFDGFRDPNSEKGLRLCIDETPKTRFVNINAPEDLKNMVKSLTDYTCKAKPLSPVSFQPTQQPDIQQEI